MASMQEIRQKYPQYNDLSDEQLAGALHKKFYSDMPFDQFATKIGLNSSDSKAPAEAPHDVSTIANRMYELGPVESAKRIGSGLVDAGKSLATGIVQSAKDAYSAPYRAYTGDLPMTDESGRTSDQAIAEGFNMATWATPTSIAAGTGKQIARNAALEAAKRPPSEGAMVAQAARDLGVTLPRAISSDKASVQQMGKVVANVPIAGQPLRKASKEAIQQLDDAAKGIQDKLGSGDRLLAGEQVRAGLKNHSKNVLDKRIEDMEADLASTMAPDKLSALPNTRALVEQIKRDRFKRASNNKPSKAVAEVEEALSREGMTFDGLRAKRAEIRQLRDLDPDDLTKNDYSHAELDRLYGALTADLKAAAKNAGGDKAVSKFDEVVSAEAKIAEERKALTKVLGRNLSDEALADRLARMAGDKSTANFNDLARVRAAVSDETWNELSSSIIAKLGRDAEGRFTPDRLVSGYGGLSEGGKKLLFGPVKDDLDKIAAVSSRFKKLNEYANPSGSGMTLMGGSYFAGAYMDPISTVGALIGANVTARMLAKPASAKALADYARAYEIAAKTPGQTSQNLLAAKARTLALIAANGNERNASNLAANLATIKQTAAEPESDEQVRSPVGNPEPDKASQEFNDAYLNGRAL